MNKTENEAAIEENWTWSPTQIKALETCPYQFYLRYVKKVSPPEMPVEIREGLRIHDEIFEDIRRGTEKNPVSRLISKHLKDDVVEIEPEVVYTINVDGIPARIRGLPDIVTKTGIYDLKTTSEFLLDKVSHADRIQMTLYSKATGKPAHVVKIPREGYPYISIHAVDVDEDFLMRLPDLIRLGREILKGKVPKPNTSKCRTCYLKDLCPFGSGREA